MSASQVVLYTRPGCHLCDEARELLSSLRDAPPSFEVLEIDIDSDDRLLAAYLERIPVVELDGEVIGELILDADALRAKLGTLGQ